MEQEHSCYGPDDFKQRDGRSLVHPGAEDILAMINTPELLEARSFPEIRKSLNDSGYEQIGDSDEHELFTIGWNRKVGDYDAFTAATFVTSDSVLATISSSSKGVYDLIGHQMTGDPLSATDINQKTLKYLKGNVLFLGITEKIRDRFICVGGDHAITEKAGEALDPKGIIKRGRKGERGFITW